MQPINLASFSPGTLLLVALIFHCPFRIREWNSEKAWSPKQSYIYGNNDGLLHGKIRPAFGAIWGRIRREYERVSRRIRSLRRPLTSSSLINRAVKCFSSGRRILDPQGPFLQCWNKIFLISCWIALAIDPLFFYIPVIDGKIKCLDLDEKMEITACVLRTTADLVYIYHIVLQFRTGFIAPSSRVFGRGELVDDPFTIARRYLFSYFIVDILAILPLPQVINIKFSNVKRSFTRVTSFSQSMNPFQQIVVLLVIPSLHGPVALTTKDMLKLTVYSQYVPRIIRMYPLNKQVTRTSGMLTETAWAGAAFNLLLYMLFSHVSSLTILKYNESDAD